MRKYRRVIAACYDEPWAILPAKLRAIQELLELRSQGVHLTPEQVQQRIGVVEQPELVESTSRIAVLNLFGTITQRANFFQEFSGGTSTEQFVRAFEEAIEDDEIAAVVFNCDTPGGRVAGVEEASQRIFEARGTKPIIAVANPMMASAGYHIGSAADEIVAAPSATDIGSIGTMSIHQDDTRQLEEEGIDQTIVASHEHKAELWKPLSESALAHYQSRIDELNGKFVAAVARNRGVSTEIVIERFGNGRSFTAQQALERGLVDRIATLEAVLAELGVGAETLNSGSPAVRATVPRPTVRSQTKETTMNPMILTALIRLGMVDAGCTEEAYQAAINEHFIAAGRSVPEDDHAILAALRNPTLALAPVGEPVAATVGTVTTTPPDPPTPAQNASWSFQDLHAAVNLAPITAEARVELLGQLGPELATLSHSQILDRINQAAATANPPTGASPDPVRVTMDERDRFTAAARDAILARTWQGNVPSQIFDRETQGYVEWSAPRRDYSLMSLPRLMAQCLRVSGVPEQQVNRLSNAEIAMLCFGRNPRDVGIVAASDGPAYNLSGMFSNILLDASNVMLRRSYDDSRTTFEQWMRQGESLEDFKPVHKVIAGELGDPKAIPEDGEFEEQTLSDSKEQYKLTVWGGVFSHSWQLAVNDRLSSFTEVPVKQGRSLRRKQNRLAYAELRDNPAMADGTNLFDNSRTNNTTGALSGASAYLEAWSDMSANMREQKGLDAESATLNYEPRHVLFPPRLRHDILTALATTSFVASSGQDGANIWQGQLSPIEEGELGAAAGGSDTAHYLIADSMDVDTHEYAYLQGLETPAFDQAVAFDRLAIRQRFYQAFAVKAIDYRGEQRHTGA